MKNPTDVRRKSTVFKTARGCLLAASVLLPALAFGSSAEASGNTTTPPPDARPMTSVELYTLYRDKSWQWPDGAGRLEADGRRFTAWTESGNGATWAEGRWTVSDRGRLCLKAEWHTISGVYPNTTCFSHMKLGDAIYQKKEPSGDWYLFKHAKPADDDEFNKLVGQDLVSKDLERIKAGLHPAPQNQT